MELDKPFFDTFKKLVILDKTFKTLSGLLNSDFRLTSEINKTITLQINYFNNTIEINLLYEIHSTQKTSIVKVIFEDNEKLDIQYNYVLSTFIQNKDLFELLIQHLDSFKSQYLQRILEKENLFKSYFSKTNNVKVWVDSESDITLEIKNNQNFTFIKTHLPNTIYEDFEGFYTGYIQGFPFKWKEFIQHTNNKKIVERLNTSTNEFEKLTTLDKIFILEDFKGDEFKMEVIKNMTKPELDKMFNDLIK